MTAAGTIYAVVLNDMAERERLADAFRDAPYGKPPRAPVLHIKPARSIVMSHGTIEPIEGYDGMRAETCLALLFRHPLAQAAPEDVMDAIGGVALALDTAPNDASYYRPLVRQRARDASLAIGCFVRPQALPTEILTSVGGQPPHRWPLERMHRPVTELVADISGFMTLLPGDILLTGGAADAPVLQPGDIVHVEAAGLIPLEARIREPVTA